MADIIDVPVNEIDPIIDNPVIEPIVEPTPQPIMTPVTQMAMPNDIPLSQSAPTLTSPLD